MQRGVLVVQHGTQSRSIAHVAHAIAKLHEGLIGDVLVAKALNVQRRRDIGHASPGEPPAGFDYDLDVAQTLMRHDLVDEYRASAADLARLTDDRQVA